MSSSAVPSRNDPSRGAHTADDHDDNDGRTTDDRTTDHSGSGSSTPTDSGARTGFGSGSNAAATDRQSVVAREKERYGGIKWGSAFFGWLTATGTAVILTALLLAAGATVGIATNTGTAEAQNQATQNAGTLGLVGGLVLLAVLLISYYCGGYVAGRMARFNGAKQGIAVWIWAILIAGAVAIAGVVLGDQYNVLDRVGGFPRLPIGGDDATTGSIIALVIALVAALVGAILGGLAGMRFHRKVDKAGLGH
jgi:hypothetical protein